MHVTVPTDHDIYLFHEGSLFQSYRMLGAHLESVGKETGVRFSVWAPQAKQVAVAGNFNNWDASGHLMNKIDNSDIWTLFIPNVKEGELYKYEITTLHGQTILKSDPYAFYSEVRPKTASIVYNLWNYEWADQKWRNKKKRSNVYAEPMLIYEVHLGTWKTREDGKLYTYRELADELIDYVIEMGYTHIELMPLMEHPFDRSWGYQITGYFSVTSRFGTPGDLMHFIDRCHQKGIGVIMDWVPAHFCKDAHGLGKFDGTPVFEPTDPFKAERINWGTYNFDYSKPEVVSFLISNAMFWFDVFHIDGLRVDAVSQMIFHHHDNHSHTGHSEYENKDAVLFIKKMNKAIFETFPDALMIAEESTDYPLVSAPVHDGGLGFNFKWNMGWMNDMLRYMELPTENRKHHHNLLTFSFFYAFSENYILPFSHDEVVHGKKSLLNKMPGDYWQKFANLRLLYGYFMSHPGKKLLFMGGEFGQFDEWKDLTELDWLLLDFEMHKTMHKYVQALNTFYKDTRSLWRLDHDPAGFEWIDPHNHNQSVITFMRKGKRKGDYEIIVCNFSTEVYYDYRIGVPSYGKYIELFNSDRKDFGGSGQLNEGDLHAMPREYHNMPYSLMIKIPPLAVSVISKKTKSTVERRAKYA
ncbi:1,4-alpha-glucan branching protein GlgB [Pseudalkalibacillus caeni]|uniref:1,4-alpha-glucan branching enzyme GlgB n=1 Tax=Exobacillus caeni TaxID=2574798 RepID=A0A5R9F533_9BACL|nr:1,4-alpha-glucan branching protein GlgB [Pseudalkalibacillus caeni]TLS37510.1 1,4-alpha-glucan branching protein GlgB [Pseudalkalibacillus caeni]